MLRTDVDAMVYPDARARVTILVSHAFVKICKILSPAQRSNHAKNVKYDNSPTRQEMKKIKGKFAFYLF